MLKKSPPFSELVGQPTVKNKLKTYLKSYQKSGRLPFLNFIAGAGEGKTEFCRTFRSHLVCPRGNKPPLLEVNASSIKKTRDFFEQVYPNWSINRALLFLDEAHGLPDRLKELLLTILNVEQNPVRTIVFEDVPYTFNFNEISVVFGTTDQQKIGKALRDRFEDISFESYSRNELLEIFKRSLNDSVMLLSGFEDEIANRLRGNPRDAVKKAQNLNLFCEAEDKTIVNKKFWLDFCENMGILPCGLNHCELQVLKAIGSKRELSLQAIAAITGFSRGSIQKDYESFLLRQGLMDINQKRSLTEKGRELYRELR